MGIQNRDGRYVTNCVEWYQGLPSDDIDDKIGGNMGGKSKLSFSKIEHEKESKIDENVKREMSQDEIEERKAKEAATQQSNNEEEEDADDVILAALKKGKSDLVHDDEIEKNEFLQQNKALRYRTLLKRILIYKFKLPLSDGSPNPNAYLLPPLDQFGDFDMPYHESYGTYLEKIANSSTLLFSQSSIAEAQQEINHLFAL